jgi:mannose-6-phosphate isomerase-like protein (cupin superfamily)
MIKLEGDFVWRDHKNTDETFIVLEGIACVPTILDRTAAKEM